ncbi:MAG: ATP-binding protein [Elusimicrobia bacterium]|nr:ATP-binding protein [Elusimicrobiota bacterium]
MFQRLLKPSLSNSFFLFGPRGTGKTTFLKEFFKDRPHRWIDLLDAEQEERYALDKNLLYRELIPLKSEKRWVVIDEIQKTPLLLDTVHRLIEETSLTFALTGSSARKLKKGAANLLAGRAFVNYFFPFTQVEMGDSFQIQEALVWGTLPKITQFKSDNDKKDFLKAYALTYLKEEIWSEHIIRDLDPFRRFLPTAAQANGTILNYSKIARDVGVDYKTVQSYFAILEDTLLGFFIEPYHHSIRKQQHQAPKFYFFDSGVKRALENALDIPLKKSTYLFGNAFEHWLITEIYRLNHYKKKDYRFYYLRTKDQAEIDLIIERPGKKHLIIEIKSTDRPDPIEAKKLERFLNDFPGAEAYLFCTADQIQQMGKVLCLPWREGIRRIFS